jgi:hypothetical protein
LDDEVAAALLDTAVANVQRDYPVHWIHFVNSIEDLRPQRARHPVFAGSFDWHSCVHQTWLIVRLLRLRPELAGAARAREVLHRLITEEGCATEATFFAGDDGKYWERPYGWAWLLLLDAELRQWAGAEASTSARRLAEALRPLAELLRDRMRDWLDGAALPTRVGTHTNTALACALVLDAARATGEADLVEVIGETARRWYVQDANYGGFEPDAADFLSPALVEADLMRRVLPSEEFASWFDTFLPDLDADRWQVLREPVPVEDPDDPYGSHLVGLALSRAWCWRGLAGALPAGHRFTGLAEQAAEEHRGAGWRYVFGRGYAGEHWLGTFAAYLDLGALTPAGQNGSGSSGSGPNDPGSSGPGSSAPGSSGPGRSGSGQ